MKYISQFIRFLAIALFVIVLIVAVLPTLGAIIEQVLWFALMVVVWMFMLHALSLFIQTAAATIRFFTRMFQS